MELDEIDGWYEEEKQKYMEEYLKALEDKRPKEEAEKLYDDKLNKLLDKYNKMMLEKIENKKQSRLGSFISVIKEKISFTKK